VIENLAIVLDGAVQIILAPANTASAFFFTVELFVFGPVAKYEGPGGLLAPFVGVGAVLAGGLRTNRDGCDIRFDAAEHWHRLDVGIPFGGGQGHGECRKQSGGGC